MASTAIANNQLTLYPFALAALGILIGIFGWKLGPFRWLLGGAVLLWSCWVYFHQIEGAFWGWVTLILGGLFILGFIDIVMAKSKRS